MTDPTHLRVMRELEKNPKASQRELASALGVSLGKVNFCLQALIAKGFVKVNNYRKSENKLAYLYLLTPSGIAHKTDLTRRFLAIKIREYETLRAEIDELKHEEGRSHAACGVAAGERPVGRGDGAEFSG